MKFKKNGILLLHVFLTIVCFLGYAIQQVTAQEVAHPDHLVFESISQNFRFIYSNIMERYSSNHENVLIALSVVDPATNSRNYPSFNVIVRPGSLPMGELELFEENVLSEYKQVGLSTIRPILASEVLFNGAAYRSPLLQLEYRSLGEAFRAQVAAVPGEDRHYILTYIDRSETFETNKNLRDTIFNSYELIRKSISTSQKQLSSSTLPNIQNSTRSLNPASSTEVTQERSIPQSALISYSNKDSQQLTPQTYALIVVVVIGLIALISVTRAKNNIS